VDISSVNMNGYLKELSWVKKQMLLTQRIVFPVADGHPPQADKQPIRY